MNTKPGKFIPFFLPFNEKGNFLSSNEQAMRIIHYASQMLEAGAKGVAITYSANYDQTQTIQKTYSTGNWHTHTSGANQASVMAALEELQNTIYAPLQHKIRIAPITTMTYSNYGGKTHDQVLINDLSNVESLLQDGWYLLGWINQHTSPAFAIGGGISQLPANLSNLIQAKLKEFQENYPG